MRFSVQSSSCDGKVLGEAVLCPNYEIFFCVLSVGLRNECVEFYGIMEGVILHLLIDEIK